MLKKRFLILCCVLICAEVLSFSQQSDSLWKQNNVELLTLNDTALLFRHDTINELWLKDVRATQWKLNEQTYIYTYDNNKLRIWKQKDNLSLWFYAKRINDWQVYDNIIAHKNRINDTISYINIDDTTAILSVKNVKSIVYKHKNVFLWNNKIHKNNYTINDSVNLQVINDTVFLWKYSNLAKLWHLNTRHSYWQVTKSTKVWTIDELTEFWKAGSNFKLWRKKSPFDQWLKDDSIRAKPLDSLSKLYWNVSDTRLVFTDRDSVQIWEFQEDKPLWTFKDSLYLWTIILPKIDTTQSDTIAEELVREVKRAELLQMNRAVKLWQINDSVTFFMSDTCNEILHISKNAKLWKLNDTSLIWNINDKRKLSYISRKLLLWKYNDSSLVWEIDSGLNLHVNTKFTTFKIDSATRFTIIDDTTKIWQINEPTKVSTLQNVSNYLTLNDTIEIWEPNDSTKLFINKYEESGNIWSLNRRVNILNINDSTKIWQINKDVRLSIINGRLRIWQQGRGDPYLSWKESKGFERDIIKDSIILWHINKHTVIWETHHEIQVWNKDNTQELYRLNDTSLVWTYPKIVVAKKPKKISYWKFSGYGKIDLAQIWADQWAKGAQNNITGLSIISLHANYKKKKVYWDSDIAYHYGFIKAGDEPLRKNEDKVKINSIFNFYAAKKLYYSFSLSTQTQFFKGYKYTKDTAIVVSDWAAPLYNTLAIGMNYYPVKQLSVFFSPLTNRTTYVKDTSVIDPTYYGIDNDKNVKNEPGIILKSQLQWDISKNINVTSKLDIFSTYKDIKTQSIEWETSFTFKFNNFISTRLNANLIYDPDIHLKDDYGNEYIPVQFKEVISIGFFYQI